MFSSIGIPEILIILVIVLILFGGRKIPQLARDLGTGIREFKRSLTSAKDGIEVGELEWEPVSRSTKKKARKKSKKKSTRRT